MDRFLCRSISGICGFTRETITAVTTNIEGREFQRRESIKGYIEHPRSSTTDDVECFFSLLRDNLGKDFILKHNVCWVLLALIIFNLSGESEFWILHFPSTIIHLHMTGSMRDLDQIFLNRVMINQNITQETRDLVVLNNQEA